MTMQNRNDRHDHHAMGVFSPNVHASVMDRLTSVDLCAFNSSEYTVLPGFCDVHVHFREPGFSYKETILTGSLAAARGGFTAVCTMPNLDPVPDSKNHLRQQLDLIRSDGMINIYPYGAITVGQKGQELADMKGLKTCVGCGAPMAKEVLFCGKCGTKNEIPVEPVEEVAEEEVVEEVVEPEKKTCPVCEAEVTEDMAFCEVCGTKLED